MAHDLLRPHLFLSNEDSYRFQSFKKAITNQESRVVWCLRGGYGAIRLLPLIQKMSVPKNPKLLIGYSDVSSLHAVINQKWGWPSLHAPLVDRIGKKTLPAENIEELQSCLMKTESTLVFENLTALNTAAQKKKNVIAPVVGGNLMVVTSTLGTPYQLQARDKIIFLEEISERAYRIDRCLHQMQQAGVFNQAAAIVFGDFVNCLEANQKDYLTPTLLSFFKAMKIPVFRGLQVGHGAIQRPLYFNSPTVLTCGPFAKMVNYSPSYEIHKPRI